DNGIEHSTVEVRVVLFDSDMVGQLDIRGRCPSHAVDQENQRFIGIGGPWTLGCGRQEPWWSARCGTGQGGHIMEECRPNIGPGSLSAQASFHIFIHRRFRTKVTRWVGGGRKRLSPPSPVK